MINKTNETYDKGLRYRSPKVKVIEVKNQNVLCLSNGNESMPEIDYGDGSFSEE